MGRISVEIAVQSPHEALLACQLGADRVEVCAGLIGTGGLSPSAATIARTVEVARTFGTRVHVLLRPRPGGFVYCDEEWAVIEADALAAVDAGVDGIVVGGCLPDGTLATEPLHEIVTAARERARARAQASSADHGREFGVTLHRVFDIAPDLHAALEQAAEVACDRVLTSGGAATAVQGITTLRSLAEHAESLPLTLLVGGGVRAADLSVLRAGIPPLAEVHAACSQLKQDPCPAGPGGGAAEYGVLDEGAAKALIDAAHNSPAPG